jgi:hypothetical protein
MADPKAQARAAQEAAAQARAAAKDAAVAAAKAEARAESQAVGAASGPPLGSTVAAGATGIAANVPLDVFTQRSAERTVARQAEADARDLTESEQRMADSLGRGRVDTANLRDIGATETPAFVSEERPGSGSGKSPGDFADSPLGDRHAALRDSPETEAETPFDFGESPLDAAASLGDRADSLREVAGQGGGLQGVADRLHAMPESGQGRPMGNEMISDKPSTSSFGKLMDEAAYKVNRIVEDGFFAHNDEAERQQLDRDWKEHELTEQRVEDEFEAAQTKHKDDQGLWILANPEVEVLPSPIPTINTPRVMPLAPIEGGAAGGGNSGVKDPGGSEDQTWKPPPGWIDGDAILPPGMRTGAAIGGAKGNDGVDWAHSRAGATTPGPEATGGRGMPSDSQVWRRSQTNESLVGQPGKDGEANGGGGGTSAEERRKWATTPTDDESTADGMGRGGDPGSINTDQNQHDLSDIDRPGGSETESKYPSLIVSVTWHADDHDD